jgi:hypothetical protein
MQGFYAVIFRRGQHHSAGALAVARSGESAHDLLALLLAIGVSEPADAAGERLVLTRLARLAAALAWALRAESKAAHWHVRLSRCSRAEDPRVSHRATGIYRLPRRHVQTVGNHYIYRGVVAAAREYRIRQDGAPW